PEAYRPDENPEAAHDRRNTVLGAMKSMGYISRKQYKEAVKSPLAVKMWQPPTGFAAYYIETVRQFMEKKWNENLVYNEGVTVYTTLDSSLQRFAESTLVENLRRTRVRLRYHCARAFNIPHHLKVNVDTLVRHWDDYYPVFDSLFLRGDTATEKTKYPDGTIVIEKKQKFPDSLRYVHVQTALLILDNE